MNLPAVAYLLVALVPAPADPARLDVYILDEGLTLDECRATLTAAGNAYAYTVTDARGSVSIRPDTAALACEWYRED